MVGVGGRSRACLTCRARRKGCDKSRPACGQCLRSGLVCRGYTDNATVLHYQHDGHGSSRYAVERSAGDQHAVVLMSMIDKSLTNQAIETGMYGTYSQIAFAGPRETEFANIEDNHSVSAIFYLCRAQSNDALIRTCMQALVTSAIARQASRQNSASLTTQATRSYTIALTTVNRLLQSADGWQHERTLAACRLLATYEAHLGSFANWQKHTIGLQHLLVLRGPTQHVEGVAHEIFLDARLQIAISVLKLKQNSPLTSEAWLTVPWSTCPKSPRQELLDIMLQLAALLADLTAVRRMSRGPTQDHRYDAWFARCSALLTVMTNWKESIVAHAPEQLDSFFSQPIAATCSTKIYSLALTVSFYWTIRLVCLGFMTVVAREISPKLAAGLSCDKSALRGEAEALTNNIISSADYFLRDGGGSLMPALFGFPLGISLGYLTIQQESSTEQFQSLSSVFSRNASNKTLSKFLLAAQTSEKNEEGSEESQYTSPGGTLNARLRLTAMHWYGVSDMRRNH